MKPVTSDSSVHDIVNDSLERKVLLRCLGIDPELDAQKTLREACNLAEIDTAHVMKLLCGSDTRSMGRRLIRDEEGLLSDLIDHIVATHHGFLRRELPELQSQLDRISKTESLPDMESMRAAFDLLRTELDAHMLMEEQVLFPLIAELDWAEDQPGSCSGAMLMSVTMHDRTKINNAMTTLRDLTNDFSPPEHSSTAYRMWVDMLAILDADLEQHAYLETNVLLPRALHTDRAIRRKRVRMEEVGAEDGCSSWQR